MYIYIYLLISFADTVLYCYQNICKGNYKIHVQLTAASRNSVSIFGIWSRAVVKFSALILQSTFPTNHGLWGTSTSFNDSWRTHTLATSLKRHRHSNMRKKRKEIPSIILKESNLPCTARSAHFLSITQRKVQRGLGMSTTAHDLIAQVSHSSTA